MDKLSWHPYLTDPLLSHGLLEAEAQTISDGFKAAETAGHLGRFPQAHAALDKLGNNARALPGYWLLLTEIHGQQNVAKALDDFRQVEERFPDTSVNSPYRLLLAFKTATLHAQSIHSTARDATESRFLAGRVRVELLTTADAIGKNRASVAALYAYHDRCHALGELDSSTISLTETVFFENLVPERLDSIRMLPILITDAYGDVGTGCEKVLDACKKFQQQYPDVATDTIARIMGDCYARLFQMNYSVLEGEEYVALARRCYMQCQCTAGLLDIKTLETLARLKSLIMNRADWKPCFTLLDDMFEELQGAQYYRHQSSILSMKEKLMETLEQPGKVLVDIAYQYQTYAESSGHAINGNVCMVLAQAEVAESDDIEKVIEWCNVYKHWEGDLMTVDNRGVYLRTLLLACRRLGDDDKLIGIGNEFIDFLLQIREFEQVGIVCGIAAQSLLGRCATMLPDDFADALDEGMTWLETRISQLLESEAADVAADLAYNYCFLLFILSLRITSSSDTILALDRRQVISLMRKVLDLVDPHLAQPYLRAAVEAALYGLDTKAREAVTRLQQELVREASAESQDPPLAIHAALRYWSAWWLRQEVGRADERDTKADDTPRTLTIDEEIECLNQALALLEKSLEIYVNIQDAQMCLTCHYDIAKVLVERYFLQARQGQNMQARSDVEKAAEHLLTSLDIADQMRMLFAGQSPESYMFKAKMSGGGLVTHNHLMRAILRIHDPEATWDWVQKFKARSLSDMLKSAYETDEMAMHRFLDDLDAACAGLPYVDMPLDDMAVVMRLRSLESHMKKARPRERILARQEMRKIRQMYRHHPRLAGFVATGGGDPASIQDLVWVSQQSGSQDMLFVDYFDEHDGRLGISYFSVERWGDGGIGPTGPGRVGGVDGFVTHCMSATGGFSYKGMHKPIIIHDLPSQAIRTWKEEYTTTRALREEGALDGFASLTAIVKPLLELIAPGKLIVICPNGRLSGIPIHAIPTGNTNTDGQSEVLLERNPIVYVPCMSALRQCVLRAKQRRTYIPPGCSKATVVGAYDRSGPINDQVYAQLQEIADGLGAQTAIGKGVDKIRFFHKASTTTRIFHFFGHQRNERKPFAQRYLQLDGATNEHKLSMSDLSRVKFVDKAAPIVSLMACSSAESQPLHGDEPLGLVPVMLMAGAATVIGTLWSAHWPSAMRYSQLFYEKYGSWQDLARMHRRAVLELKREKPEPYFWASFVLNGSWF